MTGKFRGFTRPKEDSGRSSGKLELPNGNLLLFGAPDAFRGLITRNSTVSVAAAEVKNLGKRSDGVPGDLIVARKARIVGLQTNHIPENGEKVIISIKEDVTSEEEVPLST